MHVVRGYSGLSETCLASQIVVGDIITIEAGMKIPADCILIDGIDVECDETMYKGCVNRVKKAIYDGKGQDDNPDPFLLCRSFVTAGCGRAVVCAVGKRTRWYAENPVEDLEDDNEKTPLS